MNFIFSYTCWFAKLDVVVNDMCIIGDFEIGDILNDVWWTTCKGVDVVYWYSIWCCVLMWLWKRWLINDVNNISTLECLIKEAFDEGSLLEP
jgi:hypothetical protein